MKDNLIKKDAKVYCLVNSLTNEKLAVISISYNESITKELQN
jgi:hypothetical protein